MQKNVQTQDITKVILKDGTELPFEAKVVITTITYKPKESSKLVKAIRAKLSEKFGELSKKLGDNTTPVTC